IHNTPSITANGGSSGPDVLVKAEDNADITTFAGGFGLAINKNSAAGVAFGVAVSHNIIGNTITAYIDASGVVSHGDLRVEASSPSTRIWAFSLAASVAYSAATTGTALAGAASGAFAINEIDNDINASIRNTQPKNDAGDQARVRSENGSIYIVATD